MARSLWHIDPQSSEIREQVLPEPREGQVRIKSLYSLISSGTETLVAKGGVPEPLYGQMGVPYMEGSLALPVKYGYSLVGEVVDEVHPWKGRWVHLLHPHQDAACVNEQEVFLVPEGIPAARATLASNMETALNAVWDSGVSLGDKVLVSGFGLIGSLLARLLSRMPGLDLTVSEVDTQRIELAQGMGFQACLPEDLTEGFDLAFHCSAHASGLQNCLDRVGFEGKVVELSWYGEKAVTLNLGGSFHSQRKQLVSSQVSQLPADRRARWDYRRRKELVFELLKDPDFDLHIGKIIPFESSPEVFQGLRRGDPQPLSWVIAYNQDEI